MLSFNIKDYLDSKEPAKTKVEQKSYELFYDLVSDIQEKFKVNKFSDTDDNEIISEELKTLQKAIVGDIESKFVIIQHIKKMIAEYDYKHISYPDFYDSIEEGLFHEIFGFSVLAKWDKAIYSTDCILQGEDVYFYEGDFPVFEMKMPNKTKVEEIINGLKMRFSFLVLNEDNPEIELDTLDKKRIKIMIPPYVNEPTICIRKIIIDNPTVDKLISYNTLPNTPYTKPLFNSFINSFVQIIISGAVKSGKTTLLKAFYAERDPKYAAILIEDTKETFLKESFSDRLIHEFFIANRDFQLAIKDAMRTPHHFVMFQEVRGAEADAALRSGEKGARGLMLNYHISKPKNTPLMLASHIVDEFPNRSIEREIRRIADTLDVGIIMKSIGSKENPNRKVLYSMYEIFVEDDVEKINYIIKYDKNKDCWYFNNKLKKIEEAMKEHDLEIYYTFMENLNKLAELYPMPEHEILVEKCR